VLLLDEPASGLDPRARIEMRELLKTLRKMGKTVVISSHILSELGDMCNRIGIIEHGVLIKQGKYPDILEEIRQTREIRLVVLEGAEKARRILDETTGVLNIESSGREFQFETNLPYDQLADLHQLLMGVGAKIVFFEEVKGTLEDVFLRVTKGGL
jgi:ABC-2 type transport system ATP-binding protein